MLQAADVVGRETLWVERKRTRLCGVKRDIHDLDAELAVGGQEEG